MVSGLPEEPRQPGGATVTALVPLPRDSLCSHSSAGQSVPQPGERGDTQGHPGTGGDTWGLRPQLGEHSQHGQLDLARTEPGHCSSRLCQAGFRSPALLEHTSPGLCCWHCHCPRADQVPLSAPGPSSSPSPVLILNMEVLFIVSCLTTHFSLKQTISSHKKKNNEHLSPSDH